MKTLVLAFLAFFLVSVHAKERCTFYLGSSATEGMNDTDRLTIYFARLYGEKIIGLPQLRSLISHLETEKRIINPIPHQKINDRLLFQQSKDEIHYQNIQNYLDDLSDSLDKEQILRWAINFLRIKQQGDKERQANKKETSIAKIEMKFYPVYPDGKPFEVDTNKTMVELTRPFEVMTTPVTQWMWAEKMGTNPSHFSTGPASVKMQINKKEVQLQPDHPVEMVSKWSVLMYANRLSIERGYQPVYDFNEVKFKPGTSAEAGNLEVESGTVRIRAPNDDVYQTNGYRLPTEAEARYLVKPEVGREFYFDLKEYSYHAWYDQNSTGSTQNVGLRSPRIIDSYEFYDLIGNVWVWTHDFYNGSSADNSRPRYIGTVVGGAFNCVALKNYFNISSGVMAHSTSNNIGFRLVRTLK